MSNPQPSRTKWRGPVATRHFFLDGWGFDKLYNKVFVAPFIALARINRADFFDAAYVFLARIARSCHSALQSTQTGRVRWYAAGLAVGTVVALGIAVLS